MQYPKAKQLKKTKEPKQKTFGKPKPRSQVKRRQKKCKYCGGWFRPERDGQLTCSSECAIAYAPRLRAKQKRKALRAQKETETATWKRRARKACHDYIRERDKHKPCISCGYMPRIGGRQMHAGHYYPDGNHAMIRYDEDNIHLQCSICNTHKSGNVRAYRESLLKRIGQERVDRLDALAKQPKKWIIEELKSVVEHYKNRKEIKQAE